VISYPAVFIALTFAAILATAVFIPQITKDSRIEAFIPDHPSVLYREQVQENFGRRSPIVVAVVNEGPHGVFTPETLRLVDWLTDRIAQVPGIDPERVTSLATEKSITGTADGMLVRPFFVEPPATQAQADAIAEAVTGSGLYRGRLVSRDGGATLVVAELLDPRQAEEIYRTVRSVVKEAPANGEDIHVAGEGAFEGYLGSYIEDDASRFYPLALVFITLVLYLAYRTPRGVFLPGLVVVGGVSVAVGTMAADEVPFYIITTALPVIVIAVGVADGIHILGQYYEEVARRPEAGGRELVIRSMVQMWKPVMVTSVTTVMGFLAIAVSSHMYPFRAFGLYASLGVTVAMFLSLFTIPSLLVLVKPRPSYAFGPQVRQSQSVTADYFGRAMGIFGLAIARRPRTAVCLVGSVGLAGLIGAARVEVNDCLPDYFDKEEQIYIANEVINQRLDGTYHLDVAIETPEVEGIFEPSRLRRIEALQTYLESLPSVNGTTSIVDYLKQMNSAMHEDRGEEYRVPDDRDLVGQYFLLYSASGDPTDFEDKVDYDYRLALVQARVNTSTYRKHVPVVAAAERFVAENFNGAGLRADLTGWVVVHTHWINGLARSYLLSTVSALLAVWLTAAFCFRSAVAGLFAVTPVAVGVLLIHAVMGFGGIWLGISTQMFAAITIGVGVDFAVHTLDRMILLVKKERKPLEAALVQLFPSTGRALLFNSAALLVGFAIVTTSRVPAVARFGLLVGVAVLASFLASVVLLPALVKLMRPRFLEMGRVEEPSKRGGDAASKAAAVFLSFGLVAGASGTTQAETSDPPGASEIVQRVNARDEGESVSRKLIMEMTDRRGKTRTRETRYFRKYYGEERRTVILYLSPPSVKGTGFLTYDYPEPGREDDQWLYLPALRKVRRISATARGDYFLGTDFTYNDVKQEGKLSLEDFVWKSLGEETVDDRRCYLIEGSPISEKIAKELGYGRVRSWVDAEIWVARRLEAWDVNGNPLKVAESRDIRRVDDIWTTHRIDVRNRKTGHSTVFKLSDVDYRTPVPDEVFTERALRRGR
jgi:predicted RND superfamily exporter protein